LLETRAKASSVTNELSKREVHFFVHSELITTQGAWQYELQADELFCSEVMVALETAEAVGAKCLIFPDDLLTVQEALKDAQPDQTLNLSFRIITSFGEIKKVEGNGVRVLSIQQNFSQALHQHFAEQYLRQIEQQHLLDTQASELEAYQHAEQATVNGIWYFNTKTHAAYYSDGAFRLFGLPPQSLNAHLHTFTPFIHEDERELVTDTIDQAFRQQLPLHLQFRIVTPAGDTRYVAYFTRYTYSRRGEPVLMGVYHDLTIQKQAELMAEEMQQSLHIQQHLSEQNEALGRMFNWQINLRTRALRFTDNLYRIYGIRQGTVVNLALLHDLVHPDEREIVGTHTDLLFSKQQPYNLDFRIVRPDGKTRFISLRSSLVMLDEEPTIIGTAQDVTEAVLARKKLDKADEALERQKELLHQMELAAGVGYWQWNLLNGQTTWSPGLEKLFSLKSGQTLPSQKAFLELVHPEDRDHFSAQVSALVSGQEVEEFGFRVMRRGEQKRIRTRLVLKLGEEQKMVLAIFRDTTTEVQAKENLHRQVQVAEMVANASADRIVLTDTNYCILNWNRICEETFNLKKEKVLGRNIFELIPSFRHTEIINGFEQAVQGKEIWLSEQKDTVAKGVFNLSFVPVRNEKEEVAWVLCIFSDVTKDTELKKQLGNRIKFIERLLEASVDRIIVLDKHMNYQYWNKRAEDYYGIRKDEVIGKNILELFPSFIDDPSYAELRKALKGETAHITALRNLESRKGYFETYLIPIKNEKGEVENILWIAHDLTAEFQLTAQQQKAAQIFNAANAVFVELDKEFRYRFLNNTALQTLGRTKEELQGRVFWEVFPEVKTAPGYQAILQAHQEQRPTEAEYFSPLFHRWVYLSVTPTDDGIILFFYDRQDIKEAQQKLQEEHRRLNEAQGIGLIGSFEWNYGEEYVIWSDELYRICGLEPQSERITVGRTENLILPEDQPAVLALKEDSFKTPGYYEMQHRILLDDGTVKWVTHRFESVADEAGNIVRVHGTLQDIDELKKTEQELSRKNEVLEALYGASLTSVVLLKPVMDETGEIVDFEYSYATQLAEQMMGKGPVVGKRQLELFPGVKKEKGFETQKEVFRTGQTDIREIFYPHEGFNRWFKVITVKLGDVLAVGFEDITERKQAQIKLELQATIDRQAEQIANIGNWQWNLTTGELTWGKNLYRIFNFEPYSVQPTVELFLKNIHPDDWGALQAAQKEFDAIDEGPVSHPDYRIINEDGSVKHIHTSAAIIHRNGEKLMIGTSRDITKEHLSQQQLKASLDFTRHITKVSPAAITIVDLVIRRTIYLNEEMHRWLGYSRAEFDAMGFMKPAAVHPDDTEKLTAFIADFADADNEETRTIEFRMKSRNGEVVFIHSSTRVLQRNAAGKPMQLLSTLSNITDRKKAEEETRKEHRRLKEAQAVGHVGSFEWTVGESITLWSDELYRINGLEPQSEETTIEKSMQFIHPEDVEVVERLRAASLQKPGRYGLVHRIRLRNGAGRWVNHQWESIAGPDGKVQKITGIVQDITERKKAEEEIRANRELLQTTVDSSLDMIQVFEAVRNNDGQIVDFRYILLNEAAEKWMPGALGQSLLQLQPGVVQEGIFDAFKKVVETGVPQQYEKHYVHEQFNGWYLQSVVKLNDGVTTTTADITARKKAEEDLRLAKQGLQATLDSSPYVIQAFKAVRNEAGTIVDFTWIFTNNNWNKLHGDVIGKSLLQQSPGVVETGLFQKFVEVTETGITIDHEQYYSHEQFHDQWFHQTLVKMGDGFVMNTEDITERKRSEAEILRLKDEIAQKATDKYKALFDSVDEGFAIQEVVTDENGNVRDVIWREVNGAFEQQSGMKNVVGKKASEFLPNLEQAWLDALTEVYKTGKPLRAEDYTADLNRWITYQYSRIGNAGSPLIACIFNDISQRKRREEQQEYLLLLNDALRPLIDPIEVQRKAMEVLGTHLKVDRVVYSDINIDDDYFEIHDNYAAGSVQKITGRFPFSAFGASTEKNKKGEILVIHNVDAVVHDDNEKQQFFAMNVHAVVAVPLVKEGKLVMNLSVHQAKPRHWRDTEIALIEATAERTWTAVERAKAEEGLRSSENKFRTLAESLPMIVSLARPDGTLEYINQWWTEFSGHSAEEFIRGEWASSIHTDERERVVQAWQEALITGQPYQYEFRALSKSGAYRWLFARGVPVKDERGNIVKWINTALDIHDRKQGEDRLQNMANSLEEEVKQQTADLQKSLAILQQAEELAGMGSWEYDLATGKFTWSEGMYELFGLRKGMQVQPEVYLNFALEEDRSIAKRIVKNLKKKQQSFEEELRIQVEGSQRLLKVKGTLINDEEGRPERIIGVDLDITGIRKAEEKLGESQQLVHQTAAASPDAITIFNLDNKQPVYLNDCLAKWLGYELDELVGMGTEGRLQLVHPDDRLRLLQFNERIAAAAGDGMFKIEYRVRSRSGETLWIRNRAKPFHRNTEGRVTHLLSILQDITEEKKAQRRLEELNDSLQQQNKMLEDKNEEIASFAFVGSHDLREPLRKLHLMCDWLQEKESDQLSERGAAYVLRILEMVKRMQNLIDDLMVLTKASNEEMEWDAVSLDEVAGKAMAELQDEIQATSASVVVNKLGEIKGNEKQLFHLFKNMISNGIKFQTAGNRPVVIIRSEVVSNPDVKAAAGVRLKKYLRLSFADNGIGIPEHYRKKIFEVFRRLHQPGAYKGTGVGLAICKKVMEKHAGFIEVEDATEGGAVFHCYFPV
jgi:PAS domain S-box-containing protein